MNGDGVEDFVIGIPGMNCEMGAAKVISGATHTMLYLFIGEQPDERAGFSVAGAGDVNGDGYDDVIVGSPERNAGAGIATVYSGFDGSVLFTFNQTGVSKLGSQVAGMGDLNGDGFADVAVSAPNSGRVYLIDVHNQVVLRQINGSAPGHFGKAMGNAGDPSHDGVNDLIVGSDAGAFLYNGHTGALIRMWLNRLGEAVAGVGDVDGDGVDDVLIASSPTMGAPKGKAEVRSGVNGGLIIVHHGHMAMDDFGASAAGIGDLDNDGHADFIVGAPGFDCEKGAAYLFRGEVGDLTFTVDSYPLFTPNPTFVTTTDVDQLNNDDVVAINQFTGEMFVQMNQGDGTLSQPEVHSIGHQPTAAAALDIDRDGHRDLVVACAGSNRIRFYQNQGGVLVKSGRLTVGRGPVSIVAGDFNRDDYVDLAVANHDDNTVTVFLHNHNFYGNLSTRYDAGRTFAAGPGPTQLVVGDFNGDFYPDLAIADSTTPEISVLLNKKNGRFFPRHVLPTGAAPVGLCAFDLDKNFRADLAWVDPVANALLVARGLGTGDFAAPQLYFVGQHPTSVVALDMDFDGYPDLAVANWLGSSVSILLNDQHLSFGLPYTYATPTPPMCLSVSDLDDDGDPDLVAVGGINGATTVLMNHWYGN